jgi:heptaprenylglyceryl phosphate synthase
MNNELIAEFLMFFERGVEYLIERFSRQGESKENFAELSRYHLPWFMHVGSSYEIVSDPVFHSTVPNSTQSIFICQIKAMKQEGAVVRYVGSTFKNLPRAFLVTTTGAKSPIGGQVYKLIPKEESDMPVLMT